MKAGQVNPLGPFGRSLLRLTGFLALAMIGLGAPAWTAMTPEDFARRPEVQARIDFAAFDRGLLGAAIFHESNRVRRQLGLPGFTHRPELDEAADLKAVIGVLQAELVHENPLPHTATPADRVRVAGLDYREVAENIARLAVFDLPAGSTQVAVRQHGGRTEFLHPGTSRPVERQTYAAFAEAVVWSWMNSPGHRANLVNPRLQSLGCAVRPCHSAVSRHEQIYAVQVFFAPR